MQPLVAPLNANVPRHSSPAPMNVLWSLVKVMPLAPGAPGVPVPSVHESFCSHAIANRPAAGVLKMRCSRGSR